MSEYIGDLERAVELEPGWPIPRMNLARARFRIGEVEGANRELRVVEAMTPISPPGGTVDRYFESAVTGRLFDPADHERTIQRQRTAMRLRRTRQRKAVNAEIRVAIVFAEDAGESLTRLAAVGYVWIVRSPRNERAVQGYWRSPDQPFSVTLFNDADPKAPALERLRIVEMIEEHRWDYSGTHEYPILEVVGLPFDASAADFLRRLGFVRIEESSDGFVAHRLAGPHELG